MGRRKSGRDVHGWLILDKPAGPTSTAMVALARRAMGARKAGHAGTLDPAATGLLAIAFGEATKTAPYVADALKAYRFTIRWGQATTTDDAEGEVVATSPLRPAPEAIEAALAGFRGDIVQVPPQVSAVKVDGARAYDLARAGEILDLAGRPLHVARLELMHCADADSAELEMVCGKGGYVRAIARDLGAALGCHGHVVRLRRIWSGPFDLDRAVTAETLERLAGDPSLDAWLLPVSAALRGVAELPCLPAAAALLRNGGAVALDAPGLQDGDTAWASAQGRPVAVGTWRAGWLQPERVFVFGEGAVQPM